MKIAIASTNKNEDSEISSIAGRAPYFLIYKDKELVNTIKNPFVIGGGGAGFSVAKMLEDQKVDLIISGEFGDKMIRALQERNIKSKELKGIKVKEALDKINLN